jgi:5-methylcytosine-specific restriction endonuclease McrA
METEKTCKRCQKSLLLSAFGTHKKRSGNGKVYDFRRNICKACHSEYEQARRASKHPETPKRNKGPYHVKPYAEWTPEQKQAHGVRAQKRRAKLALLPSDFTRKDWKAALEYFNHKCAYCGEHLTRAEQDHFIPARDGGGYTKDNIVPACRECNRDKRAKNPIDWLSSQVKGLIAYARVMNYFSSFR